MSKSAPKIQIPRSRRPRRSPVLVVDLEATCWDTHPPQGQVHEIIEIGWALLDTDANPPRITRNGTYLVKPVRSTVSPFCTRLTTITPELVETEGIALEDAFRRLVAEVNSRDYEWSSWGDYDRDMIARQCQAFGLESPFSSRHYDIKALCRSVYPNIRGTNGMANMYRTIVRRPMMGTPHRGGDDARNTAEIFGRLLAGAKGAKRTR
ncbi:hypothetical protein M408DRAFT_16340 [Serendipita vermifera MAFF 305830]|uniref:Exonuclease domain-containing protein n=1 Tax=Serendipita vermifera MAFF 305830 TaxID=933852 RepID=A0A0C3BAE8_SERVB|nr:hypothetical protein M408DRAFT_16340 [Serendipita vermifera MAFF 305830]